MAQNDALMKAMAAHCKCMAKAHEAASDCHQSLSECFKSEQEQGLHKGMKDTHADLRDCHKSMSESYAKMGAACTKSAGTEELTKAIVAATLAAVDQKYGSMVMETGVRKVFTTEDPSGGRLIPRTGQPSPPTPAEAIDPQFRNLFVE